MPGRHVVVLSAASVSWLIAMPGAISMNAAASFSSGMKPAHTVCKKPVSCGCSESMTVSARSSISAARYHASRTWRLVPVDEVHASRLRRLVPVDEVHASRLRLVPVDEVHASRLRLVPVDEVLVL